MSQTAARCRKVINNKNVCWESVAELVKVRNQGHQGVVLKPLKRWFWRDVSKKNSFFFKSSELMGLSCKTRTVKMETIR